MAARSILVVLALGAALAACSSDDDAATTTGVATTIAESGAPGSDHATDDGTAPGVVPDSEVTGDAPVVTPEPPLSSAAPAPTGVPGLDSDDDFCSAWSRFGGSWQVLVQANLAGDPAHAARLEVIASALVGDAYEDVMAAWPAELEGERETVADGYFGPFQRRSEDARQALLDNGASEDDMARLAETWSQALAGYDPAASEIVVEVPADLDPLVSAATQQFMGQRVPIPEDPTMAISVATPDTDAFLGSACPDEGWIVGQDVDEGA